MKLKNAVIKKHSADIIIIAVILAAALILSLVSHRKSGSVTATVLQNGETVCTVELSEVTEGYTVVLDGGVKIRFIKNAAGFIESDCPDKTCVKSGMLTKPGDTAVCVPTKTVLKLTGKDVNGDVDIISY